MDEIGAKSAHDVEKELAWKTTWKTKNIPSLRSIDGGNILDTIKPNERVLIECRFQLKLVTIQL